MERKARGVLREHARLDRPDPAGLGARDQGLHERATDSATARALRDVDGALGDPGVARARRRRSESDPAHDAAVLDSDEPVLGVVARSRTRRSREAPSRTSQRASRCPRRRSPRPRASRSVPMARISITAGQIRLAAMERWATFDCYGTLVDWNAGIHARAREALRRRARGRAARSLPRARAEDPGGEPGRVVPRGAHDRARGARGRDRADASRGRGERAGARRFPSGRSSTTSGPA